MLRIGRATLIKTFGAPIAVEPIEGDAKEDHFQFTKNRGLSPIIRTRIIFAC